MNRAFQKFDLTGKTALVTGAAGLLGSEHSAALLESGALVVLTDVSEKDLLFAQSRLASKENANRILVRTMDVLKAENIKTVSEDLTKKGYRVDILINNAAIDPKVRGSEMTRELSRLENFPVDQWDLQLGVGLRGAFLCSQVFGAVMASDGKGGVILNIASDLSVIAPDQRLYRREGIPEEEQPVKPVTYSVIKTGLIGLTRYLATYWVEQGVRTNALSPGGVLNDQNEQFVKRLTTLIPLGRMAHRDEYRSAIQFLCSDASAYLNGQNIVMDGGRSIW